MISNKSNNPLNENHDCREGKDTYTDPFTGYSVFTADYHLKRGYCCFSKCRHCPYSHWEVSIK